MPKVGDVVAFAGRKYLIHSLVKHEETRIMEVEREWWIGTHIGERRLATKALLDNVCEWEYGDICHESYEKVLLMPLDPDHGIRDIFTKYELTKERQGGQQGAEADDGQAASGEAQGTGGRSDGEERPRSEGAGGASSPVHGPGQSGEGGDTGAAEGSEGAEHTAGEHGGGDTGGI